MGNPHAKLDNGESDNTWQPTAAVKVVDRSGEPPRTGMEAGYKS